MQQPTALGTQLLYGQTAQLGQPGCLDCSSRGASHTTAGHVRLHLDHTSRSVWIPRPKLEADSKASHHTLPGGSPLLMSRMLTYVRQVSCASRGESGAGYEFTYGPHGACLKQATSLLLQRVNKLDSTQSTCLSHVASMNLIRKAVYA